MITSDILRKQFIDFFQERDHQFVRGTPLILPDDPTLLFANAGMNQFKKIFLDREDPRYSRAVNTQRCMRVSGKHNDLEEVGFSPHHHTLFEMLGSWSFGDYYKKEAIDWAWELLTDVWKLPKEKLWLTVFKDEQDQIPPDQEAADLWKTQPGIIPDQIRFFGRKDNLWEMGETGPCGPCTEIHIDRGPEFCNLSHVPGHECSVNGDCRRIVELWNLVFIQYNRFEDQHMEPLSACHVDTGMGLERIVSVVQGTRSNYDTDLFTPIIKRVQEMAGQTDSQREEKIFAYRVIADHIRAATFLLTDGIMPSNEWRGYVLRRILRRGVRFGTKLGFSAPFMWEVAATCIEKMKSVFPELEDARAHVQQVIRMEESRFFKTLSQSLPMVKDLIRNVKKNNGDVLPGKDVFKLYDTFGFPVDITREIAEEEGLRVDESGFEASMDEQRVRARSAWKSPGADQTTGPLDRYRSEIPRVIFSGYSDTQNESEILIIVNQEGEKLDRCENGDEVYLVINPCPFYAEAGGQIGDTGTINSQTGIMKVLKTIKGPDDIPVLSTRVTDGAFLVSSPVSAQVNEDQRQATERNHTATHLLHAALRQILGDHVKQSGSMVSPLRLRFDFTHFAALEPEEIHRVESLVNRSIIQNYAVTMGKMSLDDALDNGITALFGERYGEVVRTVSIDDISAELCGGTHVRHTGDIGLFKIVSEASIAAGVRRIDAVTGYESLSRVHTQEEMLVGLAQDMKSPVEELPDRVERLLKQIKSLSRELEILTTRQARNDLAVKLAEPETVGDIQLVRFSTDGLPVNILRDLADQVKNGLDTGIGVLASVMNGKVILIATVTQNLTDRIKAGNLVGKLAKIVGGGGGGRPDMAQAGGTQPGKLPEAMEQAHRIIESMLIGE